jgi:hypothetical protein
MSTIIELAPVSRRQNWEKALAFAFATGAPALVSLYLLSDRNPLIALIAGSVCFLGVFVVALSISTANTGRLAVQEDQLLFTDGHLSLGVPLADLDVASARTGDDPDASPRLITRPDHAVTIPRRTGRAVVVTPLHPVEFIEKLRRLA